MWGVGGPSSSLTNSNWNWLEILAGSIPSYHRCVPTLHSRGVLLDPHAWGEEVPQSSVLTGNLKRCACVGSKEQNTLGVQIPAHAGALASCQVPLAKHTSTEEFTPSSWWRWQSGEPRRNYTPAQPALSYGILVVPCLSAPLMPGGLRWPRMTSAHPPSPLMFPLPSCWIELAGFPKQGLLSAMSEPQPDASCQVHLHHRD